MSDPSPSTQQQVDSDRRAIGPWQTWLEQFCGNNGLRPPVYSIASDRRGGRTAWSAAVEVNGAPYLARYWYDGNFITNAKEDAAQVALERLETPEQHQQHQASYQQQLAQTMAQQPPQSPNQQQQNNWPGQGR
ncbi:hypothetical protein BT63DRAFT_453939 [Microthyrium microscopicum]|uniref:DRBM domain-containing protein n=1 Tax=Microthyrium microscopicum TaxID=703497 RepID=A0A6A6UJ88_9PEZI|nr:hypothetical protein BT63DRAFT_453939 [Microthyrium microscopicum]